LRWLREGLALNYVETDKGKDDYRSEKQYLFHCSISPRVLFIDSKEVSNIV